MSYTEEERKDLLAARDKIVAWCMENVIPKLPEGRCVEVSFGNQNKYNEREYVMLIRHGVKQCLQYVEALIEIGESDKLPKNIETLDDNNLHLIWEPVIYWSLIKQGLMGSIERINHNRELLKNFEP